MLAKFLKSVKRKNRWLLNSVAKLLLKPLGPGQTLGTEKEGNTRQMIRMPIRGVPRYNWDGIKGVKG